MTTFLSVHSKKECEVQLTHCQASFSPFLLTNSSNVLQRITFLAFHNPSKSLLQMYTHQPLKHQSTSHFRCWSTNVPFCLFSLFSNASLTASSPSLHFWRYLSDEESFWWSTSSLPLTVVLKGFFTYLTFPLLMHVDNLLSSYLRDHSLLWPFYFLYFTPFLMLKREREMCKAAEVCVCSCWCERVSL